MLQRKRVSWATPHLLRGNTTKRRKGTRRRARSSQPTPCKVLPPAHLPVPIYAASVAGQYEWSLPASRIGVLVCRGDVRSSRQAAGVHRKVQTEHRDVLYQARRPHGVHQRVSRDHQRPAPLLSPSLQPRSRDRGGAVALTGPTLELQLTTRACGCAYAN